jgi:hypothetical protein
MLLLYFDGEFYNYFTLKMEFKMNILNRVINWFYKENIFEDSPEINCEFRSNNIIDFVTYNPATGLPLIGGLAIMGNLKGTSSQSDYSYHKNLMDNYYRFH